MNQEKDNQQIKRLQSENEVLKTREERFRSLFENSTIGMYRTTQEGEILMVNPQALRLLGYKSFEELAQRNLEKEGFEPTYPRKQFIRELLKHGKITGLESAWKTRDGTTLYVRESAVVVQDKHGKVKYFEGTFEDITDRKKAEISLKESKEQLDHVLSGSNEGFFDVIIKSREIIISSRYQEILGCSKPRRNIKLSWKKYYEFIHPDDLKRVMNFTRRILESRQKDHFEIQFRINTLESEDKYLQIRARAVGFNEDGSISRIAGTASDITEKVHLQESLQKSEQRYRALFEFSPIGLWEEDFSRVARAIRKLKKSGLSDFRKYLKENPGFIRETEAKIRILNVNNTAVAMYQARSKEHLMQSYDEVFRDSHKAFVTGIMDTIFRGEYSYSRENDCLTLSGRKMTVYARWSVAPGYEKDYSRIYITDSDITGMKKTEAALKKAKKRAEESDKLKSAFLANMSHEIRTPMNSIIGFSEILEEADSFSNEEKQKFLSIIQQNGKQLLGLINDIIDISKIEAGQLSFSMSHFDVNAVLNELLLTFRSQIQSDDEKKHKPSFFSRY
ncbi:MAG: PAS domain S-box protein [Bacteroidota bacterium]|nr:PAS domain S-box protein [Bacteroidota bacterium]